MVVGGKSVALDQEGSASGIGANVVEIKGESMGAFPSAKCVIHRT